MTDELRPIMKKLFEGYEARIREHDKKIEKAWNEIDRRRKKLAIVMLIVWAGLVGLVYYFS